MRMGETVIVDGCVCELAHNRYA